MTNEIQFQDGAVCYAKGEQLFSYDEDYLLKLRHEIEDTLVVFKTAINAPDFQLNEIRTGDFIAASELGTEQKYNDVVEVFGLFGIECDSLSRYLGFKYGRFDALLISSDGYINVKKSERCKRQLTYEQIMTIGKLKRMSEEKEMKYPGIYRNVREGKESPPYLFMDKGIYFCSDGERWGKMTENDNHDTDINITREYLANTCGEVKSKDHAELLFNLAKNNGLQVWPKKLDDYDLNKMKFFVVVSGELQLHSHKCRNTVEELHLKKITIPEPPKPSKTSNSVSTVNRDIERNKHKTAKDYLAECMEVQNQRGEQYDSTGTGERSFDAAAKAYNALTGGNLKGSDICLILTCVKTVRQYSNPERLHEDSLLDMVSYSSLWAEELNKELK